MTNDNKPVPATTIKLSGDQLVAAREIQVAVGQREKLLTKLNEEFNTRQTAILEEIDATAQELWARIVEPHDIDAEDSWGGATWGLDTTYLEDHGAAYLRSTAVQIGGPGGSVMPAAGKRVLN